MTTIEDKLDLFARIVFEKVDKGIKEEKDRFKREIQDRYDENKALINGIADNITKEYKKKAELKYTQIVSRARVKAEHEILKKKKDMSDMLMDGLKMKFIEFTGTLKYFDYLRCCVLNTLNEMKMEAVVFYFTQRDMEKFDDKIYKMLDDTIKDRVVYTINTMENSHLGGLICTDIKETLRMDYTFLSLLEDKKSMIAQRIIQNF